VDRVKSKLVEEFEEKCENKVARQEPRAQKKTKPQLMASEFIHGNSVAECVSRIKSDSAKREVALLHTRTKRHAHGTVVRRAMYSVSNGDEDIRKMEESARERMGRKVPPPEKSKISLRAFPPKPPSERHSGRTWLIRASTTSGVEGGGVPDARLKVYAASLEAEPYSPGHHTLRTGRPSGGNNNTQRPRMTPRSQSAAGEYDGNSAYNQSAHDHAEHARDRPIAVEEDVDSEDYNQDGFD
jgi:hypothetical protein